MLHRSKKEMSGLGVSCRKILLVYQRDNLCRWGSKKLARKDENLQGVWGTSSNPRWELEKLCFRDLRKMNRRFFQFPPSQQVFTNAPWVCLEPVSAHRFQGAFFHLLFGFKTDSTFLNYDSKKMKVLCEWFTLRAPQQRLPSDLWTAPQPSIDRSRMSI